jgi:hypothetical protein
MKIEKIISYEGLDNSMAVSIVANKVNEIIDFLSQDLDKGECKHSYLPNIINEGEAKDFCSKCGKPKSDKKDIEINYFCDYGQYNRYNYPVDNPKSESDWESQFNSICNSDAMPAGVRMELKSFIRSVEKKAKEEERERCENLITQNLSGFHRDFCCEKNGKQFRKCGACVRANLLALLNKEE